jgi:bifunctional DNA-binding transcriptional regulator/antitoxin component of YhaV-PrlF toxin-antitoxin module
LASKDDEWKCFGPAPISSQGQVTIPKPAREAVGFDSSDEVWVFANRDEGRVLLTHEPVVADVLASAAKSAKRKRPAQT